MNQWKYTDATNRVASRLLPDGRMESCLAAVLPEGTEILPADPVDFRTPILSAVRTARELVLNRLAGIALFDPTKQLACAAARLSLLALPTAPSVVAAQDEAALKAALVAEYQAIVVAAGVELVSAFAEFNL